MLQLRLLCYFHYGLCFLSCHHFFTEILLPIGFSAVGNKGSNSPCATLQSKEWDRSLNHFWLAISGNFFFTYATYRTPSHPCSYCSPNSSLDFIDISTLLSKANSTCFQIQNITSYLAPHTKPIPSKMLSHKPSSYSYSIQFLFHSAYFQFLFCKFHFPLPFHQAQWDVCSAPLHTLPAKGQILISLRKTHPFPPAILISAPWPRGTTVREHNHEHHPWTFPYTSPVAACKGWSLPRSSPDMPVLCYLVCQLVIEGHFSCLLPPAEACSHEGISAQRARLHTELCCHPWAMVNEWSTAEVLWDSACPNCCFWACQPEPQPLMLNVIQGTTCRNRMEIAS